MCTWRSGPGCTSRCCSRPSIVVGGSAARRRADAHAACARRRGDTFGERAYGRAYNGLLDGARRITLVTQSGSLPVYLTVVFAVVVLALGVAFARGAADDWGDRVLADSLLQAAVALLAIAIVALAVVMARRRFVSVLLLGGVGPGPDRDLPDVRRTRPGPDPVHDRDADDRRVRARAAPPAPRASRRRRRGRRAACASGCGRGGCHRVAWFALGRRRAHDRPTDVTDDDRAAVAARGGRASNVVNVTIVDFRGIDTMFEITVFGIAALGVANLVTASRAERRLRRRRALRQDRRASR